MKLTCDLCGNELTPMDNDHAKCDYCGLEYGADRLQELRESMHSADPVPPVPPVKKQSQQQEKKPSGCGIWFFVIMAVADLLVGTHGIVAVFCVLIIWLMSRASKKK